MTRTPINTDRRLLDILDSGKNLLRTIDPQGLLSDGTPVKLMVDIHTTAWKLTLSFFGNRFIDIYGSNPEKTVILTELQSTSEQWPTPIGLKPAKTLTEALGDLSRVPARLKPFLSRSGLKNDDSAQDAVQPLEIVFPILKNALFYRVEDAKPETGFERFRFWKVTYRYSPEWEAETAEVTASFTGNNSVIKASMAVDIYGLGNKRIELHKNLGEEHAAIIDCTGESEGKTIPSLRVAMDLDKKIPILYFPQLNEHIGKGNKQGRIKK